MIDACLQSTESTPADRVRRRLPELRVHGNTVFWGAVVVAVVPFIVSAVTVLTSARGYHAWADNALTELNVRDVGPHVVEVGVFNRFGWHHLGPAVFYLLAPVYRGLGSRSFGLLIGALLLNGAAVMGIALAARRRAGVTFAIATLAGIMTVAHSLGPAFLRSPWTPHLVVLPFALLVLLSWSLAEGDTLALPWGALVASFIVQAHLAPALPVAAMLATGLAFGARQLRPKDLGEHPSTRRQFRRRVLAAVGVLAFVWMLPFVDVVTHAGGNPRAVIHYFLTTHPDARLGSGYRVVADQLAIPPPWLGRNPLPQDLLFRLVVRQNVIPWMGLALVVTVVAAWRAGQGRAARFGMLVAVALTADAIGISRVVGAIFWWDVTSVPVTAMCAALAVGYAIWSMIRSPAKPTWAPAATSIVLVGALVLSASMLTVTSADATRVPDYAQSLGFSKVMKGTLRSLRGVKGSVSVRVASYFYYTDLAATVVLLRQHHIHAVVDRKWRTHFPGSSMQTTSKVSAVVTVLPPESALRYRPARGERQVAGDSFETLRTYSRLSTAYRQSLIRETQDPQGGVRSRALARALERFTPKPVVFVATGSHAGDLRSAQPP